MKTLSSLIRPLSQQDVAQVIAFLQNLIALGNPLLADDSIRFFESATTIASVGVFEQNDLIGILQQDSLGLINVVASSEFDYQAALSILLPLSKSAVTGLQGSADACLAVKRALFNNDDLILANQVFDVYELAIERIKVPARLQQGQVDRRLLSAGDNQWYLQWLNDYYKQIYRIKPDGHTQTLLEHRLSGDLAQARLHVLEVDDIPTSTCRIWAQSTDAIHFDTLWTPIDFRSREYGRSMLASLILDAWSHKISKAYVLASPSYPAAHHCYLSLGFKKIDTLRQVICKKGIQFKV